MTQRDDNERTVEGLAAMIDKFEQENPGLVAELDFLGMQVEDYLRLSAEYEPKVITSSGSAMP